ncbi:MAG: hypothetical protein IPO83_09835 [Chitinophagaceae bacterium]|nr:hypothetical protein [Chitinophagaceae bacterium]
MERTIIENSVAKKLEGTAKGWILFADDFLDIGSRESINKALFRLKEKGVLIRLAFGIYLYPKTDKELGILYPATEDVAAAIAKRDHARIIPTGIQALNKLGLSTQVPLKAVFLTDGASRSIRVGKRTITFKRTGPKNLLVKGELSGLVIQALKTIGKKNIDKSTVEKIKAILKREKKVTLINDAKLAPAWIHKILMSAIK